MLTLRLLLTRISIKSRVEQGRLSSAKVLFTPSVTKSAVSCIKALIKFITLQDLRFPTVRPDDKIPFIIKILLLYDLRYPHVKQKYVSKI